MYVNLVREASGGLLLFYQRKHTLTMPVLSGTQIYKINLQTNFNFSRTNALDSAYPWETDPTLGLTSWLKSIGLQFEINLNKML